MNEFELQEFDLIGEVDKELAYIKAQKEIEEIDLTKILLAD